MGGSRLTFVGAYVSGRSILSPGGLASIYRIIGSRSTLGAGIAQWLERRTRARVRIPARNGGENFLLQGRLLVLLFRYPFHPRVTIVA